MQSANDYYSHFVQPKDFVEFNSGFFLSEGIYKISVEEQCSWLLQIICFQPEASEGALLESWTLKRNDGLQYLLQGKDSRGKMIFEKTFVSPDFLFEEIVIWKMGNYLILPSEYNEFVKHIRNETGSKPYHNSDDKTELN